jgi:microcystin-dependent protein
VSDQFLGEIRIFPFNFAPADWALCDGQILPISQYTALFSLLGTFYGGNGTTNFALPNLQSRVPVHQGKGTGLSSYSIGQTGGTETVKLSQAEMPVHSHPVHADATLAKAANPVGHFPARSATDIYADQLHGTSVMNAKMLGDAGGGQPHDNIQPYLVLNFCIALTGIYPSRN